MSTITVVGKVYQDGVLVADSGAVVPVPPTPTPIPPAPTPTPPGTCPPPPQGMVTGVLAAQGGVVESKLTSGQVVCYPLPIWEPLGRSTLVLNVMESTATTPGSLTEICISKCPGVIDPNGPVNSYGKSTATNWLGITWAFKITPPMKTIADYTNRGYAWAPTAEGPWYCNIRVTYPTPPVPYWGNYDQRNVQWGEGDR